MDLNKDNIKKILGIVTFAILLFCALLNIEIVLRFASFLLALLSPFLIGLCLAFILNVPMRSLERALFELPVYKKGKKLVARIKRPVSLILTILLLLGVVVVLLFIVIPEIVETFGVISSNIPKFWQQIQSWVWRLSDEMPDLSSWVASIQFDWNKLTENVLGFLKNGAGNFFNSTMSIATSVFSGIFNSFLGIIFACYILMQKEKLGCQIKKLLYAVLPSAKVDRFVSVCRLSNQTFSSFLSGQCLEACILGVMFFITMNIFRLPYALMISVLIAVTALIPVFGAFIGLFVGAFLILVTSPIKALWFVILFLVLQQIEGNFIYPKVVGNSVGLPAIWVLVAVTIGGSTMGVLGMLIGVPLCSVIYCLLREFTQNRLRERKISAEKYN